MCQAWVSLQANDAIAEALEAVVGRCFGPGGGQVLFTRDSGEVLITRDGWKIISSLHLDHPVARVLVDCVSAHWKATGDGAKSFLLLLAALLRGIRASCHRRSPAAGGRQGRVAARRVAVSLLSFQARVLDGMVERYVAPRSASLLPGADPALGRLRLQLLMEAYFQGKVSSAHCGPLSELACDFYRRWRCEGDPPGVTALVSGHFQELHTAVTGLPLGRSQVLEGLVLHRDFAALCPADGPLRALAVSEPLQPPLASAGIALTLTSAAQIQGCLGWVARRVEQAVSVLRQLKVRLLLSAVKQSDLVLDHARRAGVSVVECIAEEELSLFCRLTGVQPVTLSGDGSQIGEQHVATVMFSRPVVLGPNRYAHLGLQERQGFLPHCLVLCGPVPGLTDQCISVFRDATRMLQRVYEPVQWHPQQGGEEANGNEADCTVKRTNFHNEVGLGSNRGNVNFETQGTAAGDPQVVIEGTDKCQVSLFAGESQHCFNVEINKAETSAQNGQAPGPQPSSSVGNDFRTGGGCLAVFRVPGNKDIERGYGMAVHGTTLGGLASEETSVSCTLIEPGSVLPVGGAFEFLLHHYLLQHASQSPCPDTQEVCRLVAEALLSVPRRLYSRRRFLEAHSRFLSSIRTGPQGPIEPMSWRAEGLESLACKHQLLVSVLQCLRSLLSVDLILHTSTLMLRDRGARRLNPAGALVWLGWIGCSAP
ncbi:Bardet-Biedl syndrome 10 protein [Megalops cyprinoides]|uniref:Bardet-Biedl syndrome 10 protein n=1 Tax=Megalops cyprinoides TaxID=118141 RepID=UPI0018648A75|nr:Bardet-Biedl syndrome 10 protein [Megalops cyprinoides]